MPKNLLKLLKKFCFEDEQGEEQELQGQSRKAETYLRLTCKMAKNYDYICTHINHEFGPSHCLTMSALYSAEALVTTVLNSLILISIWKTPSLHKPSYILIASLALSDLLVGAIGGPLQATYNIADFKEWSMDNYCPVLKSSKGVIYALAAISLLTLTFISLDRLLAVKILNRYQSVVTKKRVFLVLVACWIVAVGISATLLGYLTLNSQNFTALMLFLGIGASVLVLCISVCYWMAFYSLRKITLVSPSVQNAEEIARPSSSIDVAKYRKSLVTMFVVFIFTILFYTPFASMMVTSFVLRYKGFQISETIDTCVSAAEFILLLNSAVNPLLYIWRIRDIREAVKTTVKTTLTIF